MSGLQFGSLMLMIVVAGIGNMIVTRSWGEQIIKKLGDKRS